MCRLLTSIVRRYWGVRTTKFFLTFPSGGKKFTAVLLMEKHCEPTKTVGIGKMAPLGSAGRFVLGRTPDGSVGGILIFAEDITHRKQLEEALSGMSRKLIEAHEQERTRIGRDLHDDIVQRLALLAIELEGVQRDVPDSASELRSRIGASAKPNHGNNERCSIVIARIALFETGILGHRWSDEELLQRV